ncbi:MAG: TOBE domain-containing protein, partial [Phenylobacterium sp.]|nr:TOBE domain-containing protein [Phenylobacterium sp.]
EAMLMADDLALMAAGRIIQVGAPRHCYLDPVSPEAARLLGEVSLLAAQVANGTAHTAFGPVPASGHPDGPARVAVRPEGIIVGGAGAPVRVAGVAFGGAFHEVDLAADHAGPGASVRARLTGPPPAVGQAVRVTLDPALARVFPATT